MKKSPEVNHLLLLPSMYGALTWGSWLVLYWLKLIPWDEMGVTAAIICLGMLAAFVASSLVFHRVAAEIVKVRPKRPAAGEATPRTKMALATLHIAGLIGVGKYVVDLSQAVGGLPIFVALLLIEPHRIRWQTEVTSSVGTQVSYAGWIAIAWTTVLMFRRQLSWRWSIPAALQFMGNLLFIDRTRPIWILFTAGAVLAPEVRSLSLQRAGRFLAVGSVLAVAVFVALGTWIGKISEEKPFGNTLLPSQLENIYYYGTSGFAYLNHVVEVEHDFDYRPSRILYPLMKAASAAGMSEEPPAQIIEFYSVPFDTNVGTGLEPFYRDGGIPFSILGMFILTFGLDALSLWLIRQNHMLADFAAANLSFTAFIAFFTPKVAAFPIWLFVGLGIASVSLRRWLQSADLDRRQESAR